LGGCAGRPIGSDRALERFHRLPIRAPGHQVSLRICNLRVTIVGAGLVHRSSATVIVRFRVDVVVRQEPKGCVPAPGTRREWSGPWQPADGVGARLEQDFERFADLFVGLVASAGRVVVCWCAPHPDHQRCDLVGVGKVNQRVMFPPDQQNGSSRAAIRPRPHQGRLALKRSVALTLVLASGSSLAASTFRRARRASTLSLLRHWPNPDRLRSFQTQSPPIVARVRYYEQIAAHCRVRRTRF